MELPRRAVRDNGRQTLVEAEPDPVSHDVLSRAMLDVVLHLHKLLGVKEAIRDLCQEGVPI
jgi:hypothetical protein